MDETIVHRKPLRNGDKSTGPVIDAEGSQQEVIVRDDLKEFLRRLGKVADVYILSHAHPGTVKNIVKQLELKRYLKDWFSTRNLKSGELGKKFNLANANWLLIDNLPLNSDITKLKMKILGGPTDPEAHFIHVKTWRPTSADKQDHDLNQAASEAIKLLSGSDKSL